MELDRLMTHDQAAAIFTEWDRRYRENPDEFWSSVEHLLQNTPETYGDQAAAYFLILLAELEETH